MEGAIMVAPVVQAEVFVEVFTIRTENIPDLIAWKLNAPKSQVVELGRKLAHRLRIRTKGHWIYAQDRLVTDAKRTRQEMMDFLKTRWESDDEVFKAIRGVEQDGTFAAVPHTIADLIAFGVEDDLRKPILDILRADRRVIQNAVVEREHSVRGWVVGGEPVISITLRSRLVSAMSLPQFIKQKVQRIDDLNGLPVRDKTGTLRGLITGIVGPLEDFRDGLLAKTTRDEMKKRITEAPDDELIVQVTTSNRKNWDYIVSVLEIVVGTAQFERLQIDGQEALPNMQIQPSPRYEVVNRIAKLFADLGYINVKPYSLAEYSNRFAVNLDSELNIRAKLANGKTCACSPKDVLNALHKAEPFRRSPTIPQGTKLRIGVLNLIGGKQDVQDYLRDISQQLFSIGFPVEFTGAQRPSPSSRREMEAAIGTLQEKSPHIVLTFLPGTPAEEDSDLYLLLKTVMVGVGIASQVIYERTLGDKYAASNIILGILAKTGTIPYVLERPLPYTDYVVGIDLARDRNQRSAGSRSMAAMTRIYAADGDFLHYTIIDTPVEGETISAESLRRLLPMSVYAGKRCVVHRDGLFRGNELTDLEAWGKKIGADFYPVEIVKSDVPRLYKREFGKIVRPDKGTAFFLNDREAFLVSSLAPHKNSTPRPLLVRTKGDLGIADAVHSVLALTHLHYGSILMPRLPVSLHYSDRIAYLLLRGVRPSSSEGSDPWWV